MQAIRDALPGKFIVGNVASLDNQQKGQEFIIAVARELQSTHPELHFLLVGGGNDEALLQGDGRRLCQSVVRRIC